MISTTITGSECGDVKICEDSLTQNGGPFSQVFVWD